MTESRQANHNAQALIPSGKGASAVNNSTKAVSPYLQDRAVNIARQNAQLDKEDDILDSMLRLMQGSYPNG